MRVIFLTTEWVALERLVRREADFPEGMPSVYLPWLRYKGRGYEVDVFVFGDFDARDCVDFRGCKIHLVPQPRTFRMRAWPFPLSAIRSLVNAIILCKAVASVASGWGRESPNIVYTYRASFAYLGWLIAQRYRATFVKRFYGTFAYSDWRDNGGLRTRMRCFREFLRWLSPCDMLIVSNDGTSGDRLAELVRVPQSRFRMWLNGVDKRWDGNGRNAEDLRRRLGLTDDHLVLMCLSRLAGWKRQDRVIRAMPAILAQAPNARLVIVGDGPERGELEDLVRKLGLQAHVQFTGMIGHDRVRDMIGVADVFLQTNDVSCLGNTLLEAMVCGKTIVTWDVGTTRDVVIDGENGCLMPNAEPETIAQTVISLVRDPDRRRRLAEHAKMFAQQRLQSWDERLDMEIDLIENIRTRPPAHSSPGAHSSEDMALLPVPQSDRPNPRSPEYELAA